MNIFVSYRRSDSRNAAGRLVDHLLAVPGIEQVFFDVQSIVAGEIFAERISNAIEDSEVVIVVIGENWLGPDGVNRERLKNEDDFVRREIIAALETNKKVIPLLINSASMPKRVDLPERLRPICSLNAPRLRHESFNQDVKALSRQILGISDIEGVGQLKPKSWVSKLLRVVGGVLISGILIVILASLHKSLMGVALDQTIGRFLMLVVILISLFAGALVALKFWK